MAHGAKEQLYHPQFYKTSPCSEPYCKRGSFCAFMHGPSDARELMPDGHKQQLRDPIPDAALTLEMHQPSYWNPPRYHALEEPPRGISFGFGFGPGKGDGGKGGRIEPQARWPAPQTKRRQNRRAARAAQALNAGMFYVDAPADMMTQGEPHQGLTSPMGAMPDSELVLQGHASQGMHFAPYMYQWVPCQENGNVAAQLLPPPFGYGGEAQAINPFGQSSSSVLGESSSCSWTNGGGDLSGGAMPFGYQMAVPSAYIMSPQQQALMLLEQLADKTTQQRQRGGSRNSKTYLQTDGFRTPSSLGSQPQTATPSEAPTPRSDSPRVLNQSAPTSDVSSA
jgi:hypothetical protein